jgi:hypothetical protein
LNHIEIDLAFVPTSKIPVGATNHAEFPVGKEAALFENIPGALDTVPPDCVIAYPLPDASALDPEDSPILQYPTSCDPYLVEFQFVT